MKRVIWFLSILLLGTISCKKETIEPEPLECNCECDCEKVDPNDENGNEQQGATEEEFVWDDEHEYVDLGLPSGTLWATCNIGATKPEEYGDYFAWAVDYSQYGYIYYTQQYYRWQSISNYKDFLKEGIIDENLNLNEEYDTATSIWGKNWKMPTLEDAKELLELKKEIVEINGVKGMNFIGYNGNSLFLPFAGFYSNHIDISEYGIFGDGEKGEYRTATKVETPNGMYSSQLSLTYSLSIDEDSSEIYDGGLSSQHSIRAIVKRDR